MVFALLYDTRTVGVNAGASGLSRERNPVNGQGG
jgi:hypothetical protein